MISRIIGNHNGMCAVGSVCCEALRISRGLQQHGHATLLEDPVAGLNGHPLNGVFLVISMQPEKHNGALQDFFARNPHASIGWRPHRAQIDFVEDVLEESNIKVLHVCIEEAYRLTRLGSLSDSAKAINEFSPATIVVVSEPSGAAACRYGVVTKVLSHRIHEPANHDGNGAAFFGGFLGALLNRDSLPLCLDAGHRLGAESARGLWPPTPPAPVAPLANTEPELVPCK